MSAKKRKKNKQNENFSFARISSERNSQLFEHLRSNQFPDRRTDHKQKMRIVPILDQSKVTNKKLYIT